MDMFDLVAHRARVTPNTLAVEDLDDGTRYSYAKLNTQAARFAAAARQHWGLNDGDRVAWLGHNRAEFFVMLFGCAKAGLILVPMNWRLASPELETVLEDCQPAALIYGDELNNVATTLDRKHPSLKLIGVEHAAGGSRDYHADLAAVEPDLTPHPERNPDTPWYLLYTSGTTGQPKGVIHTFRMMLANYLNIGTAVNLTSDDTLLNVLPMFHTAGINLYATPIFVAGGTVLVQRQFEAETSLAYLAEHGTVFFGVPAVYQAMLDHPAFNGDKLRGVRSWGCGGAPLSLPIAQRFVDNGIHVRTGMGMTETGPTVFLLDENHVLDKIGSVGTPQLLAEVRLVDDNDREVPRGEPGELLFRGAGVTPGYWGRPEATRNAFGPDGWLHSATSPTVTQTGTIISSTAARICTSPAAKTSTRPKSNACWYTTPPCPKSPLSACRTNAGAKWARPISSRAPTVTCSNQTSCVISATNALPATKYLKVLKSWPTYPATPRAKSPKAYYANTRPAAEAQHDPVHRTKTRSGAPPLQPRLLAFGARRRP